MTGGWIAAILMFCVAWYYFTQKDKRIAALEKENDRLATTLRIIKGNIASYLAKPIAPRSAHEALDSSVTWEDRLR